MMEIDELAGVEYLKTLTAQIKQINELSKESFELRYEKKKDICSNLGKHGWVVSGNITPTDPREWLHSIELYGEEKIAEYFTESEMGRIIDQITGFYDKLPESNYTHWAISNYLSGRYTESAVFLLALLDYRIACITPDTYRKKKAQCNEGLKEKGAGIFKAFHCWPVSKTILLIEYLPSFSAFAERLFYDGQYTFKNGIEPPYLNRNWLLHGRMTRRVKGYECIQLMNAIDTLIVIEKSLNQQLC